MELALYHLQNLFYGSMLMLLIVRFVINAIIYRKIDSDIIQANIPDHWKMMSFSEKQKEEIRRKNPEIKDFSQDGSQTIYVELLYYIFTFWWPLQYNEDAKIMKLKKVANKLNILFIILAPLCLFLFLYLQDANFKYRHIEKDVLFFLN